MYGDQFGEFVCGYWGLKGQENELDIPFNHLSRRLLFGGKNVST